MENFTMGSAIDIQNRVNCIGNFRNNCENEILNYANLDMEYLPFISTNLSFEKIDQNVLTSESFGISSNDYSPLLTDSLNINTNKSFEGNNNNYSTSIETPKKNYLFPLTLKNSNFLPITKNQNNGQAVVNTSQSLLQSNNFNLPEFNEDNSLQKIKEVPKNNLTLDKNRIQKTVNYFNHKFVISETEDISVDTLLSLNQNIKESIPNVSTDLSNIKHLHMKPIEGLTNAITEIQSKENTKLTNIKDIITKKGESILKNSEHHTNIQPVLILPKTNNSEVHKQVYFVKDNCMKPIISPEFLSSGIFRSTGKKRKSTNPIESDIKSPKNIILSKSPHGKIISLQEFEKTIIKNNSTKYKSIPCQSIETIPEDIKPKLNRQLIKIPVAIDNNENINNGQTKDLFSDENKLIPANNLVLNIVNMFTNSADITQKTQVSQSFFPLDEQQIKAIGSVSGTLNSTGKVSILDDKKSVVIHNAETNTKVIYRIINPEDVNLRRDEHFEQVIEKKIKKNLKQKKPGRPKGVLNKGIITYTVPNSTVVLTQATARTRSGRLSRPPKHVENYFQISTKFSENSDDLLTNCNEPPNKRLKVIKDDSYVNNDVKIKRERKIPSEYKCKTCNKMYLGYNRMSRHLEAFPDHGNISQLFQMKMPALSSQSYDDNLYEYLLKKVQKACPENRAKLLFDQISHLSKNMQLLMPKLISENLDCPFEIISKDIMKILGITNGKYRVDTSIIDQELLCLNKTNENIDTINDILPHINQEPSSIPHQIKIDYVDFDSEKTNISDDSLLQIKIDELVNMTDDDLVGSSISNFRPPILDLEYLLN